MRLRIPPRLTSFFTANYRFFLGGVALVILFFGYSLVIEPRWEEIRTTGVSDLREEEQRLTERRQYRDRLERLATDFRTLQRNRAEEIRKLRDVLPNEADIPELLVQLDGLAAQESVQLDTITVVREGEGQQGSAAGQETSAPAAPSEGTGSIRTLQVSVHFTKGQQYAQFKEFLRAVEEHIRLFDVISLQYAPARGEAADKGEVYQLNFKTYYTAENQ